MKIIINVYLNIAEDLGAGWSKTQIQVTFTMAEGIRQALVIHVL